VKDYHDEAVNDKRTAFANYLETMPGWESLANCDNASESCDERKKWEPDDPYACGRARVYFGFDANFINDKQICQDIKQFQNSRDFVFLEEFFNQGTSNEVDPEKTEPPLVPPLELILPVAGKYLYEFGNGKNLRGADWLIIVSLHFFKLHR
jgi:hypothetical protein